jgi:hypothetical protein
MDISNLSKSGESATIAVAVDQDFRRPAGQVLLYEGRSLQGWEVAGWNDIGLANLAEKYSTTDEIVNFPISLKGGDMAWLYVDLPLSSEWKHGWNLKLAGQGVKVSAWMGRHMIGRIWLPSKMRPRMAGGADDRMVLPSDWLHDTEGKLWLLLESVSQDGQLSNVKFIEDT